MFLQGSATFDLQNSEATVFSEACPLIAQATSAGVSSLGFFSEASWRSQRCGRAEWVTDWGFLQPDRFGLSWVLFS